MLEIVNNVVACIEQYRLFPADSTIVVAVSGGADSLCLLHLLHQLCGPGRHYSTVQLHVAHLDHQLRSETSAQDASRIAHIAASWGLPATIDAIDVPALARSEQRSIEDAARVARYRFLRSVAKSLPAPVRIAVAHHKDDQVETLLLHWLRGGGITSMIGLQPHQQDIIRPLLALTHADTLAYCQQHNLVPLEDESNTDPRFLRNRIRHELLPLLASMNSGIRSTLLRNAEVMQVDASWVEAQVDSAWRTVIINEQKNCISLHYTALLALPLSLQRHLLRRVTARMSGGQSPLELRHYKLIEQLLQQGDRNDELTLHLPEHIHVTRKDDRLIFTVSTGTKLVSRFPSKENKEAVLPVPGRVTVPGTLWTAIAEPIYSDMLQAAREALYREDWKAVWRLLVSNRYVVYIDSAGIDDTLRVRTRRAGDRIQPLGMAHEKKVQDVLVDKQIARAEREQIPIFFAATHCVWLAGIALDERMRLNKNTQNIVRLSIVPDETLIAIDEQDQ